MHLQESRFRINRRGRFKKLLCPITSIIVASIVLILHYSAINSQKIIHKQFHKDTIGQIVNAVDAVSFEVLGTLLQYPYAQNEDIFSHLERLYNISGFKENRIGAQRQVCTTNPNCSLTDIYSAMHSSFHWLQKEELRLHTTVLIENKEMKEVYEYALAKNRKIVFIANTYLPYSLLRTVLLKNGFPSYSKLYRPDQFSKMSTDCNHLGSREKRFARKILYIGQNCFRNPCERGTSLLIYVHYPCTIDRYLASNPRANIFWKRHSDDIGASILVGILSLTNLSGDYWIDFSYTYGGPILLGYMIWLHQQLKFTAIRDILFVARDGYTLEKVFNLITRAQYRTHYVYAPRKTAMIVNFDSYSLHTTQYLLKYYKTKNAYLSTHTPTITSHDEGLAFIRENQAIYDGLIEHERQEFAHYLQSLNLTTRDVAVVDTLSGYLTSQRAITHALSDYNIHGFYWVVYNIDRKRVKIQTFNSDCRTPCSFNHWNIMELFMSAPTSPIDHLEHGKPIFRNATQEDKLRIAIYPSISRGIILFAKHYLTIFKGMDVFFKPDILTDWINILCDIPTEVDKQHFQMIKHAGDSEHKHYRLLMWQWYQNQRSSQQ